MSTDKLVANTISNAAYVAAESPESGGTYKIKNLNSNLYLDNTYSRTTDGNPVGTYMGTNGENQSWKFLEYPSSARDTIFTLQVISTLNSFAVDDRGGYLRIDSKDNSLVQGGQPQAWKLIRLDGESNTFKIAPFEPSVNPNGKVLTDSSSKIPGTAANKVEMKDKQNIAAQKWTFEPVN